LCRQLEQPVHAPHSVDAEGEVHAADHGQPAPGRHLQNGIRIDLPRAVPDRAAAVHRLFPAVPLHHCRRGARRDQGVTADNRLRRAVHKRAIYNGKNNRKMKKANSAKARKTPSGFAFSFADLGLPIHCRAWSIYSMRTHLRFLFFVGGNRSPFSSSMMRGSSMPMMRSFSPTSRYLPLFGARWPGSNSLHSPIAP